MSEHASERGHLRYSLRAMFVAIAILGLWLGWNLKSVRDRDAMLEVITSRNGFVDEPDMRNVSLISVTWSPLPTDGELPMSWRVLGAKPVRHLDFYEHLFEANEIARVQALFPEADIALWRSNIQ
jgi:hypothetical protein